MDSPVIDQPEFGHEWGSKPCLHGESPAASSPKMESCSYTELHQSALPSASAEAELVQHQALLSCSQVWDRRSVLSQSIYLDFANSPVSISPQEMHCPSSLTNKPFVPGVVRQVCKRPLQWLIMPLTHVVLLIRQSVQCSRASLNKTKYRSALLQLPFTGFSEISLHKV